MKGLLIDLDGTLLDDRFAMRQALSSLISAHSDRFSHIAIPDIHTHWSELTEKHWLSYERGLLSLQDQRRYRFREFMQRALTDDEADALYDFYVKVYLSSSTPLPGVVEFLAATVHLPRVIVTNGYREQQILKIKTAGLSEYIQQIVTPAESGCSKPDPRIFIMAAEKLSLPLEHCFYIGDDLVRDIEPAQKLGMRYFHVDQNDPGKSIINALKYL